MPHGTFVEIPEEEQAQMLAVLRRARYGYLLALHILLLCATGRNPTEIAAVLFCSRSSVYRTVRAYQEGSLSWEHDAQGRLIAPAHTTVLLPTLRRSLLALLKAHPRAYGWCRTRWSCAALALTLQAKRGIAVSDKHPDLEKELARRRLPVKDIRQIQAEICAVTGKPRPLDFHDRIVALIEYRDGSIIDVVRQVKE